MAPSPTAASSGTSNTSDLYTGSGSDSVDLSASDFSVAFFGAGDDTSLGSIGSNYLNGNAGNDRLDGGSGRDALIGEDGDDFLLGGDGDDNQVYITNAFGGPSSAVSTAVPATTPSMAARAVICSMEVMITTASLVAREMTTSMPVQEVQLCRWWFR